MRSPATPSSTPWPPRASSSASSPRARCPSGSSSPRRCRSTARASTSATSTATSRPGRARRSSCSRATGSSSARSAGARCARSGTSEAKALIPTSIYAITKRDHEEMSLVTGAAYGIPTVALRFFNVYGPGQALSNPYTGVAAIFASRLLNDKPPVIFEDGQQSRDFTHVSDIVRGILLALESEDAVGHAVNLGTGRADHGRRGRATCSPRAAAWTSSRSATSSTARATSATATRTPLAPGAARLRGRASTSRTAWRSSSTGSRTRRLSTASTRHLGARGARPHPLAAIDADRPARPGRPHHHHRLDQRGELARALPDHGLRPRGRGAARCRRRGQRVHRRHARACRVAVPDARVVDSANRGFAHANNRGAMTTARYVLFLNPDTEIVDGTFGELVATMDARPDIGLAGVRQVTGDGTLWPTIRYFPSVARALGDAFASERWPRAPGWAGERELDLELYDRARVRLDVRLLHARRRDALLSAGLLDERFFIYSEEPDLCLRMKRAGWEVRHLPSMTIVHHAGKAGVRPRMVAQDAYTRRQYARKHFGPPARVATCPPSGSARRYAPRHRAGRGGRAASRRRSARAAHAVGRPSRRSARRRRRRSVARARASGVAVRRPQPPVRVACRGERFRGRNDRALRGGRSVVPTRHPASETT